MRSLHALRSAVKPKSSIVQINSKLEIPQDSTIFSAIQPTGVFHLGNYLGAIRSWVDIQAQAPPTTRLIFATADLHALTVPKDPSSLQTWRRQALASILAAGIDPERCTVYHQSTVPAHTQLNWVLSTVTGMGSLNRMTQWKSKANVKESSSIEQLNENALKKLQLGLFAYPVLQAADILIHKAHLVPVGEDQSQHLELTRQITTTFNSKFGDIFPIPRTLFAPNRKIASLRDPLKKMSKSDPDANSCIYITDEPVDIEKKVRRSVTDSHQGPITYDPMSRPGVANLLQIASGLLYTEPESLLRTELSHVKDHKELKDSVADIIVENLKPIRVNYARLMSDGAYLDSISNKGTIMAHESASKTLKEVFKAVGL